MYKHVLNLFQQGVPISEAEKVCIMIHGRGGSAPGILPIAAQFGIDMYHAIAPSAVHNSWYPYSFLAPRQENQPALDSGLDVLDRTITNVLKEGVKPENIILFGFSQGACLALEYVARYGQKDGHLRVGVVIAFTGGLIGSQIDKEQYTEGLEGVSVWISGGDRDVHVPLERMEQSKEILSALGADVHLKVYPEKLHSISFEELEAVKQWLINK